MSSLCMKDDVSHLIQSLLSTSLYQFFMAFQPDPHMRQSSLANQANPLYLLLKCRNISESVLAQQSLCTIRTDCMLEAGLLHRPSTEVLVSPTYFLCILASKSMFFSDLQYSFQKPLPILTIFYSLFFFSLFYFSYFSCERLTLVGHFS